jgi:trans-aconitate methyltransferase
MKAYFDDYSENYKDFLAASTGENLDSASFFASQKVSHLSHSISNASTIRAILDYGCGIGMSLRLLQRAFPHAIITGVDPSTKSLEVAGREHSSLMVSSHSDSSQRGGMPLAIMQFHAAATH